MADNSGLFGDGMMGGYGNNITAANIIRSRYRQPIAQAAMENAPTHEQFLSRPENSILPNWMSNSSNNSVMGKIDLNDPYSIEQARNANPTANEEAGLEMPMLADPYNYVGMGLGTGAANAVGKFVAPKANQLLEDYMIKSGMQLPMFAGVGAKTADRASFNIASKMKEAGVADREIHAQTGWTFGFPDGRPRFEIDDSAATGHFTHLPPSTDRLSEKAISHPSVYQAYPELSKISQLGLRESKEAGSFSPTYIDDAYSGGSLLAKAPDETGIKSVGLHELQHAVQQQEGFARGGSPDNFAIGPMFNPKARDMATELSDEITGGGRASMDEIQFGLRSYKGAYGNSVGLKKVNDIAGKYGFTNIDDAISFLKLEDVKRSPFGQYQRLAGEAEARLTQSRMNMTAAERAASYPPSMFDVPVDQQIVRFGDGPAMSTNNQPLVNALRSK